MSDVVRKRPIMKEHFLQVAVKQFCRDAIDLPPEDWQFFAFDSAQKATDNQRARMIARGVVPGTPDCMICVRGKMPAWIELKHAKGVVSGDQARLLDKLEHLGHSAFTCWSVAEVRMALGMCMIKLRPSAYLIASDLDLKVAARLQKAEQRASSPGRATRAAPRFTAGRKLARRMNQTGVG